MTWLWLRDHVLPGLIVAAIVGASHAHLWRRIRRLTSEQTARIERVTAEQTKALKEQQQRKRGKRWPT